MVGAKLKQFDKLKLVTVRLYCPSEILSRLCVDKDLLLCYDEQERNMDRKGVFLCYKNRKEIILLIIYASC